MAGRRVAEADGNSQYAASNGETRFPPPSTLAAQIVQNRTSTSAKHEPESQALFGILLQEYLADPVTEETSVETNAQLVAVVAEAGLDKSADIFAPNLAPSSDRQQLVDSLKVIQLTIKRCPDVLLFPKYYAEAEDLGSSPPLLLWLLPKLFGLLVRHASYRAQRQDSESIVGEDGSHKSLDEVIRMGVLGILKTSVVSTWKAPHLLTFGHDLEKFLRKLVDDILEVIETAAHIHAPVNDKVLVKTPSASCISMLWPGIQAFVAVPLGYQFSFQDQRQAAHLALIVMAAVSGSVANERDNSVLSLRPDKFAWALDCCRRILHHELLHDSRPQSNQELLSDTCVVLQDLLVRNGLGKAGSSVLLNHIINVAADLIELLDTSHVPGWSTELSSLLISLKYQCSSSTISMHAYNDTLTPLITTLIATCTGKDANSGDATEFICALSVCVDASLVDASTAQLVRDHQKRVEQNPAECFATETVWGAFRNLSLDVRSSQDSSDVEERPAKRLRRESPVDWQNTTYHRLLKEACRIFDSSSAGLDSLPDLVVRSYDMLSDEKRYQLLYVLGNLPCSGSRSLAPTPQTVRAERALKCKICHQKSSSSTADRSFWNDNVASSEYEALISSLHNLTTTETFRKSRKARILAAHAIRRLFNHLNDPAYLDVKGNLGQWCLRSMQSSVRELRIASTQAVMSFLGANVPAELCTANRLAVLEFLRSLTERNDLAIQDTLVFAWGLIGQSCGEQELIFALLSLVEYLGHSHALVASLAYEELARLCDEVGCSALDLFKPHWKTIAINVVKDLNTRPQKAQHLADLLEVSVRELLLMTQTHTLPFLIQTKRKDILAKVAQARGPNVSIQDLWLQPKENFAAVLASLLLQQVPDPEQAAVAALQEIVPTFSTTALSGLARTDPNPTACEILKLAAEGDERWKNKVHHALRTLATMVVRVPGQSKTKQSKLLSAFFEDNLLGIMAHFTDTLDIHKNKHSMADRKQALRAVRLLITMTKSQLSPALPQLRATLQAVLNRPELTDLAFSVWAAMVAQVGEEDIEYLVDHTFAIIVQNWDLFSSETQILAHDTIAQLLKSHNALIRDRIEMVPNLSDIPILQKFDSEITRLKNTKDITQRLDAFSRRCQDENATVVRQSLKELVPFLAEHQKLIHESALSQQPASGIAQLYRALLDAAIRFKEIEGDLIDLCAKCIGILGSIDPNMVEAAREKREILMLSNFGQVAEVIEFVASLLENVLVKAFRSAESGMKQIYLAYVIQQLLRFCGFQTVLSSRSKASQDTPEFKRWMKIPESVRSVLMPYFHTKYIVMNPSAPEKGVKFPIFSSKLNHSTWLRTLVFNLLHRGKGENAQMIFQELSRVIWNHDLVIPEFVLPFAMQNVIVGGSSEEWKEIRDEIIAVLSCDISALNQYEAENVKRCSENIFQVLDYLARWLQEKRKRTQEYASAVNQRAAQVPVDFDEIGEVARLSTIERLFSDIPPEVVSARAVDCGAYARALFHWEKYLRASEEVESSASIDDYAELQRIYANIEEPDGIEGLSAHLHVLDLEQQILEHRRAGRWSAAQSWYEVQLAEAPDNHELQSELLACLKASGQYDSILNFSTVVGRSDEAALNVALPFATEAAWSTGKWTALEQLLQTGSGIRCQNFNVGLGRALIALRGRDYAKVQKTLSELRENVARGFTPGVTDTLSNAHSHTLKLHAVYEVEAIANCLQNPNPERGRLLEILDRRLDILGSFTDDKQYLLGIRRTAMQLSEFSNQQIASVWLTSARLARESNLMNAAYNAVLNATYLGDEAAKIEHSKLLWKDGEHRKAIAHLDSAIDSRALQSWTATFDDVGVSTTDGQQKAQNEMLAHTQLLLAQWLDQAGLIKSDELLEKYREALKSFNKSQEVHYSLAKYYNKVFDAQKAMPRSKQSDSFLSGDCAKLVIDNYLRSMVFGAKYYYETVPKVLTFWLDLGSEVAETNQISSRRTSAANVEFANLRANKLETVHSQIRKYVERLPAYVFYNALPQIMSRISHTHPTVAEVLASLILRIVSTYPQQALWSLLAVTKAKHGDKAQRAHSILAALKNAKSENGVDLKKLSIQAQRLTDALLNACEVAVDQRVTHCSLQQDLGFSHKLAPCALVVPVEKTMVCSLPAVANGPAVRMHKPFARVPTVINSFMDDVLVLSSLQRPRKLTVRGSDGQLYGLLCKPKDDLRKDQRLMEFNAMIGRALKWNAESSKRRLYIRTYAVTPLNEECGAIEWVDGLKPMRDIILAAYKTRGIRPDYGELRQLLDRASANPDSDIFVNTILPKFPPVMYSWFIETFPEPEAWFAARLRYTRSCAVMSIVGNALGLGDRHGENILLEESNGGVFHVDFNCLFDKGLTFEKPELVPFRLTHNMVDAFGVYKYEGPFRTAAELTMHALRDHQDTLMTILDTFLHDPTTDFVTKPKKRTPGVPETPQEILESVRAKINCHLPKEQIPLSVEGYVDYLIRTAVDPRRLSMMYLGWLPFF